MKMLTDYSEHTLFLCGIFFFFFFFTCIFIISKDIYVTVQYYITLSQSPYNPYPTHNIPAGKEGKKKTHKQQTKITQEGRGGLS